MKMERTLERSQYRSVAEVLERYGVPICALYRWRARAAFPAAVPVGYDREPFFPFLPLVRWEIAYQRTRRQLQ